MVAAKPSRFVQRLVSLFPRPDTDGVENGLTKILPSPDVSSPVGSDKVDTVFPVRLSGTTIEIILVGNEPLRISQLDMASS